MVSGDRKSNLVPCFNSDDVVFITDMTSNVNVNRCQSQNRCSFDLFFVENERESRLYPMNSHQFSLVLLNIIAASSCFGLETIKFSRVLFLSCMSNQASSVRSIYLPPLKYRNFSIFMIELCKKKATTSRYHHLT